MGAGRDARALDVKRSRRPRARRIVKNPNRAEMWVTVALVESTWTRSTNVVPVNWGSMMRSPGPRKRRSMASRPPTVSARPPIRVADVAAVESAWHSDLAFKYGLWAV